MRGHAPGYRGRRADTAQGGRVGRRSSRGSGEAVERSVMCEKEATGLLGRKNWQRSAKVNIAIMELASEPRYGGCR